MKRRQLAKSVLATFLVAHFSGSPAWAGIDPEPFRTGLFGVSRANHSRERECRRRRRPLHAAASGAGGQIRDVG